MADGRAGNIVAYERDTTVFYFPLMRWVGQQLQSGVFPLWTPQVFGGYPLFADGEIGLAYPPALLAMWLLSPERAFVVLRLMHLWLAALGAFALARVAAAVASAASWLGWCLRSAIFSRRRSTTRTSCAPPAWLPLILALVELALRSARWRGASCGPCWPGSRWAWPGWGCTRRCWRSTCCRWQRTRRCAGSLDRSRWPLFGRRLLVRPDVPRRTTC